MLSFAPRRAGLFALLGAFLVGAPAPLAAQYFGRNKVQYEKFDFRILRTSHFDAYFYPAESLIVHDAGRLAERWYTRHSDTFRHTFDRKSLVFYADHPDFQQTNVVGESIEEGTGGITEGLRTRVVMPFTGVYADNDHVLGHELVHVFQYSIAEAGPGGLARLNALPLWLIEGMAEYFSLGRDDPLTAMWLRDAAERDNLPTIKQLTNDPRFFPYRYGQALWAYVGGRWGDRAVVDVYRASLRIGFEEGIRRVLGISTDSLSKDWIAATRRAYLPLLEGRARPNGIGTPILQGNRKTGDMNLAPTVSPDGKLVAFFARRNLFEIELYVADANTGHVIKKLAGPTSNSHFDAISFINASGAWSPDNAKFAFVAQAEGDHEIAILDVKSANVERRIRVPGVGSVTHVAWSPDGRTLAFSGMSGGISDLYLLDIAAGTVRQLTHDRNADLQPAWSPDGRTLAFATDRGATTDFTKMVFSPLQLATIDVATGQVSVFSPFSHGKHINPQYAPDGKSLFFISDQDGFSDIYRLELASGAVSRVTRLSTGVSGITSISPALTVALTSGRMLFSVFQDQGYGVYALDSARTHGDPLVLGVNVAYAGTLPPGDTPGRATVTAYLADPTTGLPSGEDFTIAPYHSVFALDAVGQPSVGVSAGGPFGTGVAGGVSFLFGDQLSDRQFALGVQANGTIKDVGGQLIFQNLKHRWNYGASVQHVPYLTGFYGLSDRGGGIVSQDLYLQRIFIDQAQFSTSYPFSSTRRVELSAGATRLGFSTQVLSSFFDGNTGAYLGQTLSDTTSIKPVYYAQGSVALVGDASYSAFTGPIMGSRYRLEVSPIAGSLSFTTALADYRKYIFLRPVTLAFRGLHYGRYGSDAENDTLLYPLFLGEEQLMRGYSVGSFKQSECGTQYTSTGACPAFDRLLGSKLAVASFEVRIPLFGVPEYGLFNLPYLPTTIAPFVDAGVAWRGGQSLQFGSSNDPNVRSPVVSTGISTRVNVLGFAILEAYLAHPFQRPGQGWIWGFQLAPGW
ncbi:MAG TPA: BamA/TamA family outer membrane protein [Gemmatimonadaceae bacterium]|nr:BamA/TamA family outer membrane protein [Gemmatimonadaceae bacterium]